MRFVIQYQYWILIWCIVGTAYANTFIKRAVEGEKPPPSKRYIAVALIYFTWPAWVLYRIGVRLAYL